MMGMIKAYNAEIKAGAELTKAVEESQFANSAGAAYAETSTNLVAGAGGQLVRGTDILFAGHYVVQKNRALDPEDIAEKAIEYFRLAETIAPIATGEYPIIFTPDGLAALLLPLGLGLDGKNVLLGASPLKGRIGEQIADPRFSLVDDPLMAFGARSSAFDEDGVPRRPLALIENGVLRNFIYDLDTAGRAKTAPTGHGANRRATNLAIAAGDTSFAEMLKGVKEGLLVNDYLGLGQGNPINGEFAANVFLGYKIENGAIVGRVKDVMLSGNAYAALKDITAISAERQWAHNWFTCLAPYIQVGGLSVSAK
jgi:PmbA protein